MSQLSNGVPGSDSDQEVDDLGLVSSLHSAVVVDSRRANDACTFLKD